ncbi:hypothetical protein [Pseudarthrobacter sp. MEB009]|uniref:hypothetical protein n=1 Tax=Pseudarthrobacter sp. MEB009 TaxID=3040326 RepID=UPI002557899E|nr:hypothetical protein [Pseudarthrobacter sp. MEB009]
MKVAMAAWTTLSLEPWAEQTFPMFGEPVQFLFAAIISAITLELLLQIFLGWPRIKVVWSVKGEDAPISEVVARIRPGNAESQVYSLKVSAPSAGWLGYQILRLNALCGAQLQIRIDQASVVPTCEASSKTAGVPSVVPDDRSNGFTIDLGKAPRRPGPWHWAEVRWRDESTPVGDEFNIDYVFHHKNPFMKLYLNALIWRSKNASFFRVVGR